MQCLLEHCVVHVFKCIQAMTMSDKKAKQPFVSFNKNEFNVLLLFQKNTNRLQFINVVKYTLT